MILIKLRYNIGLCKIRLKDDKELIKNNPYNSYFELKYNDTFDFYKENIRITKELSDDQIYIRKGQKVEEKYCYNFGLLAAVIKSDIVQNNEIFGNPI